MRKRIATFSIEAILLVVGVVITVLGLRGGVFLTLIGVGVGSVWVADETVLRLHKGVQVWFWDGSRGGFDVDSVLLLCFITPEGPDDCSYAS